MFDLFPYCYHHRPDIEQVIFFRIAAEMSEPTLLEEEATSQFIETQFRQTALFTEEFARGVGERSETLIPKPLVAIE